MAAENSSETAGAVARGIDWLRAAQREDGSWGATSGMSGNVGATAYGLMALRGERGGTGSDPVEDAAAGWLQRCQNEDGGWGIAPSSPSAVFTAAEAARGLTIAAREGAALGAGRGVEYLLGTQKPDGGWAAASGISSATHETCHAVASLIAQETGRESVQQAARWLLSCQNADGGWGPRRGEPSGTSLSVHALEVLYHSGGDPPAGAVRAGIEFLRRTQEPSGGWSVGGGEYNATFLAPVTLLKCGVEAQEHWLRQAVMWVVRSQLDSGGWPSSKLLQGGDTIFTCLAIMALTAIAAGCYGGLHM